MDKLMLVKPGQRHLYKGMVACIRIVEGSSHWHQMGTCMHAEYQEYGDKMMTLESQACNHAWTAMITHCTIPS
jgi:hypothetical protein